MLSLLYHIRTTHRMEIKSLDKIDFDTIYRAFSQAFADYELQVNKAQLQTMLQRRGFNPGLSFAAFEGNKIVAFTLNGIGNFNSEPTAYDTGTGTLSDYRGKGLATDIFEYSIPFLRKAGVKQYLLEVLQHNTKAVSVYRNLGFEVSREFNYFRQKNEEIEQVIEENVLHSIRRINLEELGSVSAFGDFFPSWQNSFESIKRAPKDFIYLGVFLENRLVGYGVFEPTSGDITQIAVDKENRRKGVASLLLREMVRLNKNDTIKVINTAISCDSITNFLKRKNIDLSGKQFEMIKSLVKTV